MRMCRKGLGPAIVWQGCHCCVLLPISTHRELHTTSAGGCWCCSRVKRGEGERGVTAPLDIPQARGEPLSQPGYSHLSLEKDTPPENTASRVAWEGCQPQITPHIALTAFKTCFHQHFGHLFIFIRGAACRAPLSNRLTGLRSKQAC